jgi:hypothetical protein
VRVVDYLLEGDQENGQHPEEDRYEAENARVAWEIVDLTEVEANIPNLLIQLENKVEHIGLADPILDRQKLKVAVLELQPIVEKEEVLVIVDSHLGPKRPSQPLDLHLPFQNLPVEDRVFDLPRFEAVVGQVGLD